MTSYFCPRCWSEFKEDFEFCPVCGYDLKNFDKLSYEEKLIVALKHPVSDYKINAIRLLAKLRSEKAVFEFERMIEEEDTIIVLEIIEALSKIPTEKSLELLKRLAKSNSKVISKRAKEILKAFDAERSKV
ncbi:conserved hypothetical protein [Ferroglobus placidus DSM 10642]|uniref:HEAT repeat domain-containing protein n=1 Tax=Ferroglobus placidus (strain DSM 10642 / AEDII12DO) TaxID=589924 RepID=D3S1A1_FERPA|nr:HEAT repeat domain-containing protein [Ferroglobus placidus]ADC64337.1 conserved hypothetical protein [Ferroglobus placidus DSM 10642]